MHQCPPWFQTASCAFLFFVELAVPFLYFAPRRLRLFACAVTILLQLLIAATGNYAFFNLLTIALARAARRRHGLPGALAGGRGGNGRKPGGRAAILVPAARSLLAAVGGAVSGLDRVALGRFPSPLIAVYRGSSPRSGAPTVTDCSR